MKNNGAVVLNSVGVVELEGTLTHVHGVSGETGTHDHDHGTVSGVVGGSRVRGSR